MARTSIELTANIISASLKEWLKEQGERPDAKSILRKAFELSFDDRYAWMLTNSNERFSVGCAASYSHLEDEQKEVLKLELKLLRSLNAASEGVPVDLGALIPEDFEPDSALGAQGIFFEVEGERGGK